MTRPRAFVLISVFVAVTAWAVGCGDGATEPTPPVIPVPSAITVSPATAEFAALHDTVQLSAVVRDQGGNVMAGATVAWVSTSPGVATVDEAGLVTAVGNGTATIAATAGAASGSATVTVAQEAQGIEVLPAAGKVSAGDTIRMTAEAWDANGYTVPSAELAWSSSDSAVAEVDGSGLVSGVSEGAVVITASSASVQGEVVLTVAHEDWRELVTLFEGADGPNWIETDGWLSDLPIGQWHGVTTNESGHVTELRLSASNLAGPIPPQLANLTHLETLSLERNSLAGPIPPELGRLQNLRTLILGVNDLTGQIPGELGDLANLEVLRLRRNDLTGPIPPELGKLRKLTRLGIDRNSLGGPFPSDLLDLERLRILHFAGNETLCAPGSASFATWLAGLDVHVGPLCNEADRETLELVYEATGGAGWARSGGWLGDGLLDDWHGVDTDSLGRVMVLDLSANDLAGRAPTSLGHLAGMTSLRIGGNAGLTGPLPLSLSGLQLQELRFDDTGLCIPPDGSFGEWLAAIPSREGAGEECAPLSDREILEILYRATGGDDWKNSENWLSDQPLGEWKGVTTDADGRVVALHFPRNNMVGTIPPEIGHLTNLSELDFSQNGLTGPTPPELAKLPNLSQLNLAWNELTGTIPPALGTVAGLSVLVLGGNDLTGPIPPELGRLSNLAYLYLDYNQLTGPIPGELAHLSSLSALNLSNNELTGPIPPALGTLASLYSLVLGANQLSGPIPTELGNISTLAQLHLNDNELTGRIPPALGGLPGLNELLLHDNELEGHIPQELGTAVYLEALTLGGNRLTGSIPATLGNLSSLEYLALNDNELTGPIPSALGNLPNMRTLRLEGNELTGPIPVELGNLSNMWTLYLDRNQLTGAVPPELGLLTRLQSLSAMQNRLAGPLPPELGGMTSLRRLHLTGNPALAGALPSGLTALDNLGELLVGGTELCVPEDAGFQEWISGLNLARVRPCPTGAGSSAYLTQAVQSTGVPVPLVAGREALLRVYPTASRPTDAGIPKVRATFYVDGAEAHAVEIPGSTIPIPTEVRDAESALEKSANARIPGSVIQPRLEMVIEIDPDSTLDAELGVTGRVPETGRAVLQVERVPVLDLTFVPFQWMRDADSSIVEVAEAMAAHPQSHEMLADTRAMLPVGDLDVKAHGSVLTSTNDVVELLIETRLIRRLEEGNGYYMGIMPERIVGGQSGVAYLGFGVGFSAADGFVIAHELGHNFALYHAPCGGAAGPDRAFPHRNGAIGNWGYDFRDGGSLVPPHARDLMSYCGPPRWVSDFSFAKALGHRVLTEGSSTGASPRARAGAPTRSLLLWGGADEQGNPYLEPAFVVDAPPSDPDPPGDYELAGRTASGEELFALSLGMLEIADADGQSSFVITVPVQAEWAGLLESISLTGPGGSVTMDRATTVPMAILRDPESGQVRGILRGEDATDVIGVAADAARPTGPSLQVLFSRGIPEAGQWRP